MMVDADGYLREVQDGEARFPGAGFSQNLFITSDSDYAGYATKSGGVDATTPISGFSESVQFGDNSVNRFAYEPGGGITYGVGLESIGVFVLSAYVEMDDASVPTVGTTPSTGDFAFIIGGGVVVNVGVDHISGNVYRCYGWGVHNASGESYGIFKYTSQSAKEFKFTGMQLEHVDGAWDSENLCIESEDLSAANWFQQTSGDGDITAPGNNTIDFSVPASGQAYIQDNAFTSDAVDGQVYVVSWTVSDIVGSLSSPNCLTVSGSALDAPVALAGTELVEGRNSFEFTADNDGQLNLLLGIGTNTTATGPLSYTVSNVQVARKKPSASDAGTYVGTTTAAVTNYSPSTYIATTTAAVSSLSAGPASLELPTENLILQSNDLSTTWVNVRSTDSQGVGADPFGGAAANSLNEDGTAASTHYIQQTLSSGLDEKSAVIFSAYLKASNRTWVALQTKTFNNTNTLTWFNLSAGTVGTDNHDGSVIEDAGSGWYRCSVTVADMEAGGTTPIFYIYAAEGDNDNTYNGLSQESVLVYGAQLENKQTYHQVTQTGPSAYIATTTTAESGTDTFPTNRGLLVEEARTNICLQSEDFENASWLTGGINSAINGDLTTAPDGSLTADQLIDDAGTGIGVVGVAQAMTVATTTTYCFSVFAKADQLSWINLVALAFTTPVDSEAWFDLANGSVGTVEAGYDDSGIQDYGNGWYRCWVTFTTDAADTAGQIRYYVAETDAISGVDRDGTSSIFVWGAQLEVGALPSTYIPTTTGSVVRNQDSPSSGATPIVESFVDHTSYWDIDPVYIGGGEGQFGLIGGGPVTTDGVISYYSNNIDIRRDLRNAVDVNQDFGVLTGVSVSSPFKVVMGVNAAETVSYANGAAVGSDIAEDYSTATAVGFVDRVKMAPSNGGMFLVKEIRYYDERLTNEQLLDMSNGIFPVDSTGVEEERGEFLSYSRPIVGTTATGTGATYIVLSRYSELTNINLVANGTVTFTVDSTIDNILWDATALTAVNLQTNDSSMSDPASAFWVNEVASGSVNASARISTPIFGIRIDITAGTGSVSYQIQQT
jgi:hypothetical protein